MNERAGHQQVGRRRLAFFGGTFDPPHAGHLAIVRAVLEDGYADGVLVAPALHPPHKSRGALTSFPHRLAMLRLAFAGIAGAEVSGIENVAGELPSYTFETLERVEAQYPGHEIVLLIGGDSLRQLHTWHRAAELVSRWLVLAYPRLGEPVALTELRRHWPEEMARRLAAGVLPLREHDLSATAIRDRLARHEIDRDPGLPDLLPPGVSEYIQQNGLYRIGVSADDNSTRTPHSFDKEHTMAESKSPRISPADLATACMEIAADRKAGNVIKIDVGELSLIAEYFVLCTAGSEPHLKGLESHLGRELLKRYNVRPRTVDGSSASQWIVMDFSGVVVHLLTEETRELYQLENLWQNAPSLAELENLAERMPESAVRRKK